jgi:hypothetical protein
MFRLTILVSSISFCACGGHVVRATAPATNVGATSFVAEYVVANLPDDVGGLSGAWYEEGARRLWTVSDRTNNPRLVLFDVSLEPSLRLSMRDTIPLHVSENLSGFNAEGLAPGRDGHLFVSSEGGSSAGIFEFDRSGRLVRRVSVPAWSARLRSNAGFEGLSVSPDGTMLYAATESSLHSDGDQADDDSGALIRLLAYDLTRAGSAREYAYRTEPAIGGRNGVSEVLALGGNELLVLERGIVGTGLLAARRRASTIRIYRVRVSPEAEVTGRDRLEDTTPVLAKTLVLDAASAAPVLSDTLASLENFEGMTFGPRLPDGSRSLLLVSDDNFSGSQVTAVLLFRMP